MIQKTILGLIFLSLAALNLAAQTPTGFWEVEKVTVGDQTMTPVAKWFRIENDGTYTGGNGWLQNMEGTWEYDEENNSYLPKENKGLVDPFGAFTVSFDVEKMIWTREEEGMEVNVSLVPIESMPKSPADQIVGLWDLEEADSLGTKMIPKLDPEGKYYLFIRWDRMYVERNKDGQRKTGYWHMHGHRPELTILPHDSGQSPKSWTVSFENKKLILTGNSDSIKDLELRFNRLTDFPK